MASSPRVKELLERLCKEALADLEGDPARFFTRAAPGKTIAQGATTISLSQVATRTMDELVEEIRLAPGMRTSLSKPEVEHDVTSAMFRGAEALVAAAFDPEDLTAWLDALLKEGVKAWDVFLPVPGLTLPPGQELALAGGTFAQLSPEETARLQDVDTDRGRRPISRFVESAVDSKDCWFRTPVEGRSDAARLLAAESLALGMDMLLFRCLLVGKDPRNSALGTPPTRMGNHYGSFQMTDDGDIAFSYGGPWLVRIPYNLDEAMYAKLTELEEFKKTQEISSADRVEGTATKLLLGLQQFAEASRLPSPTARLVWYLSALETVLLKEEGEGDSNRKVAQRLTKLLGERAGVAVLPLYRKRRLPTHHGHRNRVSDELVNEHDENVAMWLANLGIVRAVSHWDGGFDHDAFVDAIDKLEPPTANPPR